MMSEAKEHTSTPDEDLKKAILDVLGRKNLSQAQMAAQIGFSPATLCLWLKGQYRGRNDRVDMQVRRWLEKINGESAPDWVVHLDDHEFRVLRIDDRPWIAVADICIALKVGLKNQERRLKRHAEQKGLEIAQTGGVNGPLIPIEEIQWFLRTMRPGWAARPHLEKLRRQLFWTVMERVTHANGAKPFLEARMPMKSIPCRPGPYGRRLSKDEIEQVLSTAAAHPEWSHQQIAEHVGVSRTSVWRMLNRRQSHS